MMLSRPKQPQHDDFVGWGWLRASVACYGRLFRRNAPGSFAASSRRHVQTENVRIVVLGVKRIAGGVRRRNGNATLGQGGRIRRAQAARREAHLGRWATAGSVPAALLADIQLNHFQLMALNGIDAMVVDHRIAGCDARFDGHA